MHHRLPAVMVVILVLAGATLESALADAAKGSQLARQWCASNTSLLVCMENKRLSAKAH